MPIDLKDASEFQELQRHRVTCGWDHEEEKISFWREKQKERLKSLFWITMPDTFAEGSTSKLSTRSGSYCDTSACIRAGHISLDAYCDPPDTELASADKSNLTIQTFFILPQYQSIGLGRQAMDLLELMATKEPFGSRGCKYVTLNTLSKKYLYNNDPQWRWLRDFQKIDPRTFSNQEWYERRGYIEWKEEPRYIERLPDGSPVRLVAAFLRKEMC